jgi:putative salt-induced outer membrane protein YdiY
MKKEILILVTAATATIAWADDNSTTNAPLDAPAVKYPWKSSVSAGLSLARGNTDTTLCTADFATEKKTPDNEYMLGANGAYGVQNSENTANNYKGLAQWNHLFSSQFYAYVHADAMRDLIANVDYRVTVGPGAGYYLIKQTNTTFSVEAGGAFEAQHLDGESEQTFATLRFAERFEHKFSTGARFWESVEVLPQVDKFDNYVVNAETGVETTLTKSFSLKTFLDDTYQNQPAPHKLKNDAKLIAAISYKF